MLRLNLGCGSSKIEGYVNIDTEKSCNPDKVLDFVKDPLPYKSNTASEVVLFHTIEHISKQYHGRILNEVWRVLKPGGTLIISYPEFLKCVDNYKTNLRGQRDFWEATIYGRQLYPSDFHVALMDSKIFSRFLESVGFGSIKVASEPEEKYNTVISCKKSLRLMTYEDTVKSDMENFRIKSA